MQIARWRDVVLEQIRIVGLSLRREALVIAVVLGIGTLLIGGELLTGGPGFDSNEIFPTHILAFLYPFAVWRGARRFGPAFLWTLPVERRGLALARVFAGFVWLIAGLAFFVAWLLTLGLLAHTTFAHTILRVPYTATIVAYLFGSAVVVGLRHSLRWLLGAAGLLFLLGLLSELFGSGRGRGDVFLENIGFVSAAENIFATWRSLPDLAQWALFTFLSCGAGLIALWIAISRHKETR